MKIWRKLDGKMYLLELSKQEVREAHDEYQFMCDQDDVKDVLEFMWETEKQYVSELSLSHDEVVAMVPEIAKRMRLDLNKSSDEWWSYAQDAIKEAIECRQEEDEKHFTERIFYAVETIQAGVRCVHIYGNIHYNNADESDYCYRACDCTYLYIDVDDLKSYTLSELMEFINENVKYEGNITESEAKRMAREYFDGERGTKLNIHSVTYSTPSGNYWFEVGYNGFDVITV